MKRIICILIFNCLLFSLCLSQDLAEMSTEELSNSFQLKDYQKASNAPHWFKDSTWHMGVRGGVTWSRITDIENTIVSSIYSRDEYERDTSFRKPPRFVGGVFSHKKWVSNNGQWAIAMQPEISFAMQGGQFHYHDDRDLIYDIDFKFNYFLFNSMFKLYYKCGFHIMAGPQFELAINRSNIDYRSNYNDVNNDTPVLGIDLQIQENLRQTLQAEHNFSIPVGAGYEYMFDNNFGIMIEGRYNLGMVDLMETGPNGYFMEENPAERSRSWHLTFGFTKLLQ